MPRGRAPSPNANRTDLNSPVTTVPGQQYGDAAAQQAAQRAIPMAGAPNMPANQAPGAPPSSGPPPTAPGGAPGPADLMAMLQQHAAGAPQRGPLTRPTERPNEPVTAGLPMGPGPGPEALQGVGALARQSAVSNNGSLANLLQTLASQPTATAAVRDLAARAISGAQ